MKNKVFIKIVFIFFLILFLSFSQLIMISHFHIFFSFLKKKTVKYKFIIFAFISHLLFFIHEEKKVIFLYHLILKYLFNS